MKRDLLWGENNKGDSFLLSAYHKFSYSGAKAESASFYWVLRKKVCVLVRVHSPQREALRKHLNSSCVWREHNFPLLVRARGEGGGSSKCHWQQGTSLASCRAAGSIKGRASQRGSLAGAAAHRGCAGTYDALTNLVTSFLFETRPWTVVSTPAAASGFAFSLSNEDDAQIHALWHRDEAHLTE